jgi:hypothetical protein
MCDRCEADLEVVRLNPPELDWTDNLLDEDWDQDREPELEAA